MSVLSTKLLCYVNCTPHTPGIATLRGIRHVERYL
jgi:hypothetical protein